MNVPDMIDHATIEYHLDHLGAILTPRKWHGAHIIVAGGVRAAFNDIKADVARLQADNQRLHNNETEALDRMKRAETRANLADAKVRAREEEIARFRKQLADCKSSWESYYGHELQDPESEAYRNGYHAGYEAGRDAIEADLREGMIEA